MRQVTHALLTRPPLSQISVRKLQSASFDLHVLSTPPAFILSQDQTLILKCLLPGFSQACWLFKKIHTLLGFCSSELILRIVQGWSCCSVIKVLSAFAERRRRDLNPCAAVNDLLPFQGSPFGQLGYFSESIKHAIIMQVSGRPFKCLRGGPARGEGGIRTHAPLRTNGFQDRLVMTTSIPLRIERFHQTQVKSYQMKASLSTKKAVDNARVFG